VHAGHGGECGLSSRQLVGGEAARRWKNGGAPATVELRLAVVTSGWTCGMGGEGEAEAGLPKGSNGNARGAHRGDELTVVLLRNSGGEARFSHRWRTRGERGNDGVMRGSGRGEKSRGEKF
jgi:hypothetical protein